MSGKIEKHCLQIAVFLACLVPLSAGTLGIYGGTGFSAVAAADIDSHYRYLSGLLLGIGISFLASIAHIEKHSARFRLLTGIVIIGGLARLLGIVLSGRIPGPLMLFGLSMELAVTPFLCVWQGQFARRYQQG